MRPIRVASAIGAACLALFAGPGAAWAASLQATVAFAGLQGPGEAYGTIRLFDYRGGIRIQAKLSGLPDGHYAIELHQGSSCDVSFESHPGPEGQSPLMPVPAGAAGGWLATPAGPETLATIAIPASGIDREVINVPQVATVAPFKGRAILLRGERLLCGVLQ